MPSPLVSWLLPVKNGMPYLPATLASLEAQDYQPTELLVWDNGSTDGSIEELHRWIPKRITGRIICNNPLPLEQSLARLTEIAQGEFCARIDADDICLPMRLSRQVKTLQKSPDLALLGSAIEPIDEKNAPTSFNFSLPNAYSDIQDGLLHANCICHPSVMFRRSLVLKTGNYRRAKPAEDYDLWLRMASMHPLANSPEKLLRYRIHAKSVTAEAHKVQSIPCVLKETLLQNAQSFLGITPSSASRLLETELTIALPSLWRIATTLGQRDGVKFFERFKRPAFYSFCQHHTNQSDLITRAWLRMWRKHSLARST